MNSIGFEFFDDILWIIKDMVELGGENSICGAAGGRETTVFVSAAYFDGLEGLFGVFDIFDARNPGGCLRGRYKGNMDYWDDSDGDGGDLPDISPDNATLHGVFGDERAVKADSS